MQCVIPDCHSQSQGRPQPIVSHRPQQPQLPCAGDDRAGVYLPPPWGPLPAAVPSRTASATTHHQEPSPSAFKEEHPQDETHSWRHPVCNQSEIRRGLTCLFAWVALAAAFHDPAFDVLMFSDGKDPQYYSCRYTNHLIFSTQGSHNFPWL